MINLIGSLTPLAWKLIGTGALSAVLMGSCALRDRSIENRGVAKERAAVEQRGNANARKAETARRDADRLPADRLRDRYFRTD